MIARGLSTLSFFAFVLAACTGGSNSGAVDGGGASSSGGSSGGNASACTEFVVGGTIDPGLGGGVTSQVIAQAVSDYAGAAQTQVVDITQACRGIATRLGAPSADQTKADGVAEPRQKADAWCKLATLSLQTTKAQAGGTMTVQFTPPACRLSVSDKATCQGRCAGSPCDVAANPMICRGGTLSGDFCEGGELQGGCKAEAKCDGGCDATVVAKAICPMPTVSVTTSGAADQTAADELKEALETELPALLSLKAHCEAEAKLAGSLSGNASAVTDIKAACIPPLISATAKGVQDATVCAQAGATVAASVN